jgi:arylsulfatase A
MTDDVGERQNIESAHREIIDALTKLLTKYIADGRSTPGAIQLNDVKVEMWKSKDGIKE